ncbi:hypothetical protein [Chryseobacterium cucumeris]|uniref:PD-(D/E)XK nuclease domain-containing protein n=1 Tax=Chryseobacterium cucumeris TaxID=1813611 RepID=UPI003D99A53C
MFQTKEIEKIEKNIRKTLTSIESEHFNIMMGDNHGGFEEDYPGWTKSWIEMRLKDLYILIQSYLEIRQMPLLLQSFKYELTKQFEKNIHESELTNPEGENELVLTQLFRRYLEPFAFFDYSKIKVDENLKLYSILQNTGFIIKNLNKPIKNESDIYQQVKWILGLYYPSCRLRNKASFVQQFKTYNPDILIPELKTAIEYKYIDAANDNIDEFIDQIKIDATNYVNDSRFENFYAVIYIEDISIATPESIEIAWKSKQFPNNWNLVLSGHTIKNKK